MKIKYSTEEERELIILEYSNNSMYLVGEEKLLNGNYLIFSESIPVIEKNYYEKIEEKISILEAENENLKLEQEKQNEEILTNMLANTEIFEMVLGMTPITSIEEKNNKNVGGNSMIEVYATLIIKGIKTIEDVPLVIREKVVERLKQLEVPVK